MIAPLERTASPIARSTATSSIRCAGSRATASSRGNLDDLRAGERVGGRATRSAIRSTSCCWKARQARRAEVAVAAGAQGGPAGTSSARRCRCSDAGRARSTSTAAARTCSSRTTRTRSRRASARTAHVRQLLDAQRLPQRRRREDVEVAGQLLHDARRAQDSSTPCRAGAAALLLPHARALPQRGQLQLGARSTTPGLTGCAASTRRCAKCRPRHADRLVEPSRRALPRRDERRLRYAHRLRGAALTCAAR